jgi:ABC-type spermidine/putrescine transport system permease subunit II
MILNEYSASTNLPRTSALATLLIGIMMPTAIALVGLRLAQMPKDLEEAAWNLGANE